MDEYITKSDAVFAACRVLDKFGGCSMGPFCPDSGCREVREVIKDVQSADVVEVRRGRWEIRNWGFEYSCCSACGFEHRYEGPFAYCPNCGADMREEELSGTKE